VEPFRSENTGRGIHFFQYYPAIIGEEAAVTEKVIGDGAVDFK
jgi:hypothetical protein